MTYPITPNPAVHNIPPAIEAQNQVLTTQALQAMGQQLLQGIYTALVQLFMGGVQLGTQTTNQPNNNAGALALQSWAQSVQSQSSQAINQITQIINQVLGTGNTSAQFAAYLQNMQTQTALASAQLNNFFATGNWTDLNYWWTDIMAALQGVVPAAVNNQDGTASPAAALNDNQDGTANPTAYLGIQSNSDGTAVPAATVPNSPVTFNNDGTASPATALTHNFDGTATLQNQQSGTNWLAALFDNGDGTTTSLSTLFNQLGSIFGTSQATLQNLFGTTNPNVAMPVQTKVIPNITAPMSTDLQGVADQVQQAIHGGTGTNTPMGNIKPNMTQIPMANIQVSSVTATTVTQDAVGTAGFTTGSTSTLSNSSSITVGATANYLVAVVGVQTSLTSNPPSSLTVTQGSAQFTQLGTVSTLSSSSGQVYRLYFFGLPSPTTGASTVTASAVGSGGIIVALSCTAVSLIGVSSVGTFASNPATIFTSNSNSSPSMTFNSGSGRFIINSILNTNTPGYAASMSAYNQTLLTDTGSQGAGTSNLDVLVGSAAGGASVTLSALSNVVNSSQYWIEAAVDFLPAAAAQIGSTALISNTSTTAQNVVATTNTVLPNSFYNNTVYKTADIGYSTTGNTFTVTLSGTYTVTICILEAASLTQHVLRCILYHNGSVVQSGGAMLVSTTSAGTYIAQATFSVYCAANDTIQPGYWTTAAQTGLILGEATGTQCYFSIALANRSTNG